MGKINFLFGIHNHQPVGNFEHVFKDCFDKCYDPLLKTLEKFPKVRLSMHYTGPLLEWIELNEPEHFELLRKLIKRKQIEMLGGAFYEPLLPIIPKEDILSQLSLMTEYIKEKLGYQVKGMWLAERVWEPHLVKAIKLAGIEYTIVDDSHCSYAGLDKNNMFGYYTTEYGGHTLGVFPIDKELRYLIPFDEAEKAIDYLDKISAEYEGKGVTLADDGEKFGVWPNTYEWVYTEGYLEKLFSLLEQNDSWINMVHFSEYFEANPPMGKIYLPTSSYDEMMEWALAPKAQGEFHNFIEHLKHDKIYEKNRSHIRGGLWRDFLVKYSESNLMYCKMWYISERAKKYLSDDCEEKRALWKAQCNCSYWHGLFGGLYLNYLRNAVYQNLLIAEKAIDKARALKDGEFIVEQLDYDKDGNDEILVSSKEMNLYFLPRYGGAMFELDYKPAEFNFSNVLTRRKEFYHAKLVEHAGKKAAHDGDAPVSIHDLVHSKEEGLEDLLFYDWYNKYSFQDHFLGEYTQFNNFYKCRYCEEGDFVNQSYQLKEIKKLKGKIKITMGRSGHIYRINNFACPVDLTKTFIINSSDGHIDVEYNITNKGAEGIDLWFGPEFNFTLLAGNDESRFYEIDDKIKDVLITKQDVESAKKIVLSDLWQKVSLEIKAEESSYLWVFPIETISQSEGGFEKTYQGNTILFSSKFYLEPDETKSLNFGLKVNKI